MSIQRIKTPETREYEPINHGCVLRTSGISKRVNDVFALNDLDLELHAGEVHVVLGENGAGKTTLVRLLAGVLFPDNGEITIMGKKARIDSPTAARSWGISVAHQELAQFPAMSVADNLYLHGTPQPFYTNRSAEKKARSVLDEVGLLAEIDPREPVTHLSAGQRRQLQIAAAIMQDSPIVILDDPTSYLSDTWRERLHLIVANLKSQNKAILCTCHKLDEAKVLADRVTILRDGQRTLLIADREQITSANLLMGMIGVHFRTGVTTGLPIGYVSKNVESELGYDPDTLVSKRRAYESLICSEDLQRAVELQDRLVQQGLGYFEREYRIVCADGQRKWVHELTRVIRDGSGRIDSYFIGIVDMEEAQRAQEVLRQSELKYESLVANIPDVVYSSLPDEDGSRLFLSSRWESWTGQSVHEIYRDNQSWKNVVHGEDIEGINQVYSAACHDGTDYDIEYRLVHKDTGEVRWVKDHAVPIKDGHQWITRFDGIITDVTTLKNLEIALKQSGGFLSALLANAPVPILLFKEDNSIAYANPAFEELTGFSVSEISGQRFPYSWCKNPEPPEGHRVSRRQALYRKKTTEEFWVEIGSAQVWGPAGERFHLEVWNDITKEKRFTESLRSYANLVTRAQEEERKKIAREIHDETIQSLFGLCTELDSIPKRDRLPRDTLQDIGRISDCLGGVIDSLRSLCHEIRPDIIDRFGLIDAIDLFVQETEKRSGLKCEMVVTGDAPPLPSELQIALFRIVQEAINNLKKHSGASQFRLCVQFTDSLVEVTVQDSGVGFNVPAVFGDFACQGKLGLVGMRERAQLVGGSLGVDSQIGKGTTVTVRAPLLA